jgi:O-antigen ligase
MDRFEQTVLAVFVTALTVSMSLYGIWEDKTTLIAPILILIYLAVAALVAKWKPRTVNSGFHASKCSLPPAAVPLLLFWLYSAALIPFSVLPYEAKMSALRFGAYLAVYWVSAALFSRFSYRRMVWAVLFVSLVFIALYSLVQHKVAPNMIFGMERYTGYWEDGRLGGTYQCPNHIAHLFQMWIPFCLIFLLIPQFGWFWRICFAYALPLFALLVYQTQSRAGLLGAITAVGTTSLFVILRKSRRTFRIALLAVPLLIAASVGGLWAGSSMFRTRMQPVVQFAELIVSGQGIDENFTDFRPLTWLDTLEMIKDRPLTGFGPGNYGAVFEDYRFRWKGLRTVTVHAHNEYLELLAEYGLIGGLLILWALIEVCAKLILLVKTAERSYHALPAAALLGVFAGTAVHGFFDFELRIFPNALMLALLAGCVVAPVIQTVPAKRIRLAAAARWTFSVAVLLTAVWTVQVMTSAAIRVQGDRALQKQDFRKAEGLYKAAEKIDPQSWLAHWGIGQVYYHHRYYELDPARKREWALQEQSAYLSAYQINPKKEEVVYGLGRIELFLGNRDKGLDYLRQAASYKRFNDFYWRKLGIELRKAGRYEESLKAFEHARNLDRSNKTVNRNIKWLKQRLSAPLK